MSICQIYLIIVKYAKLGSHAILSYMLKIFKKYFVPHEKNDHRPHILRLETTLATISFLIVIELLFLAGAGVFSNYDRYFALILSGVLIDETNSNRVHQNLPSLTVSPLLQEAAQEKAGDMARAGYFSHVGPDGKTPWDWLRGVGYDYRYAGENLAVNFIDSKDVVDAWMNSPGHRANILNEHYTEIGIGTATGTYKGRETVFIAQYFGRPLFAVNPITLSATPAPISSPKNLAKQISIVGSKGISASTRRGAVSTSRVSVLGESTDLNKAGAPSEQLFVALENPNATGIDYGVVANAGSSAPAPYSSVFEHALASPRSALNYLLMILAGIILIALVLKIFIKIKIQHLPLIINGILLLLLIAGALILNKYLGLVNAQII